MTYGLPTSVTVAGVDYDVRTDFRVILDIMEALTDPDLDDQDRAIAVLVMFYPGIEDIPQEHWREAIERCFWFIRGGEDEPDDRRSPKLMDWKQDFPRIIGPVNRIAGRDVRSMEHFHWWSFLGAFQEIGDCLFAQIVGIRDKKARGKKLEKYERDFYVRNRAMIDIKQNYTEAEEDLLRRWTAPQTAED